MEMEPFDLYSPLIGADPFPYYAVLRDKYPCYWSEGAQLWILSRYHDIGDAARGLETLSSARPLAPPIRCATTGKRNLDRMV